MFDKLARRCPRACQIAHSVGVIPTILRGSKTALGLRLSNRRAMNHPYRETDSLLTECANARTCWACERRAALARAGQATRWLWTVTFLIVQFACATIAFACVRFGASMAAAANLLERDALAMVASRSATPPPAVTPLVAQPPPASPAWPVALGVLKVSETEFLVDRRVVDRALESQADLTRMVRIVPESDGGKVVGIRLFGVRPGTLLYLIGFQNGDRLESVNGLDVGTPEHALEAYARFRTAPDISVVLNRRGSPTRLDYHLL